MLDTDRDNIRNIQGTGLAVVFQEPLSALDPVMKVGPQVEEAILVHNPEISAEERKKMVEKVTKEDIISVSKKIYIDTIYLLGGEDNE